MPPGVTTLAAVTLAAQQRADREDSSIGAAEWTAMVQASHQELYGILVQAFSSDYFVATPFAITTDGTNDKYSLPTDFFKLMGVDLKIGGIWETLTPFTFAERNRFAALGIRANGFRGLRYRLLGSQLWLTPVPTGGQWLQLWYVPRLTVPALPTDTIDGVDGWEEYIVTDVAIKAMQKEESDVSVLMAQKNALLTRIQEEAERRDVGSPFAVADTQRANGWGGDNEPWGV